MSAADTIEDGELYSNGKINEPVAISLLICTRNRAHALDTCLSSVVAAHRNSSERCEVIIVDSNSSDNTADILHAWASDQQFSVQIVRALIPGLAVARNMGMSIARGLIVAMTDDDCCVALDYFDAVRAAFADPCMPAVIGGRIDLGDPTDLPITIKPLDKPERFLGKRQPAGFIMGANLMVTSTALKTVGNFDVRFGAGARFVAAEDTDFLVRAIYKGVPISYDPTVRVQHFHGRKTLADARSLYAGYSFGDGALYAKHALSKSFVYRALLGNIKRAGLEILKGTDDPILGRRKTIWRMQQQARGFIAYLRQR